jgi:3-hydroxybutyryl-CoA dehydrogenase
MSDVERVGVVGSGQIGLGFAELCARAGLDVLVVASRPESAVKAGSRLARSLDRSVTKGRTTAEERDATLAGVTFTSDIKDASDRQFVLEAASEHLAVKREVFIALDAAVDDPDAVLASTTSSLPIMKLARVTSDPGRVVGAHFFNPVTVMRLVELISCLSTSPATVRRTRAFVTDVLGKKVIETKDRAGFLVNSLLVPYLMAAVRLLEEGVATAEDIDCGMTAGCGHPMGPLSLIDMVGLDIVAAIGQSMYEETKQPLHAPPALMLRMIEGGRLGRKSGEGFFTYPRE